MLNLLFFLVLLEARPQDITFSAFMKMQKNFACFELPIWQALLGKSLTLLQADLAVYTLLSELDTA